MQKAIQVYIIEYSHYEEDYRMREQFACQCDVNGIVAHPQPFTGGTVFDFYTNRINGDHKNKQHEYSRYQCVTQVYRIIQPWIVQWMRVYYDWLQETHCLIFRSSFGIQYTSGSRAGSKFSHHFHISE